MGQNADTLLYTLKIPIELAPKSFAFITRPRIKETTSAHNPLFITTKSSGTNSIRHPRWDQRAAAFAASWTGKIRFIVEFTGSDRAFLWTVGFEFCVRNCIDTEFSAYSLGRNKSFVTTIKLHLRVLMNLDPTALFCR